MAHPARHHDKAGKLYLPAIQSLGSEQTRTDSPHERGHIGGHVIEREVSHRGSRTGELLRHDLAVRLDEIVPGGARR